MEELDYESLPRFASFQVHMMAGAGAGILEHCLMYPVDAVKTRMQSLAPNPNAVYRSVAQGILKMVKYEGFAQPFKGMSVMVIGAGPAHAMYFACYEKMKRTFSGTKDGSGAPVAQGAAGVLATLLHDAVMNPADVVKQRLQVYNSPYQSMFSAIKSIYRTEGPAAFYRSYTTQLTMNIPYQSLHFVIYEAMTELTNRDRLYNPSAHIISGGVAGGVASAFTNPLDVCKTLLNTQEASALNYTRRSAVTGLYDAGCMIYSCCGLRGFMQGVQARVLYSMPSTAIAWSVYEFFKFLLTSKVAN